MVQKTKWYKKREILVTGKKGILWKDHQNWHILTYSRKKKSKRFKYNEPNVAMETFGLTHKPASSLREGTGSQQTLLCSCSTHLVPLGLQWPPSVIHGFKQNEYVFLKKSLRKMQSRTTDAFNKNKCMDKGVKKTQPLYIVEHKLVKPL